MTHSVQGAADRFSGAAFEAPLLMDVYRLRVGGVLSAALNGATREVGDDGADEFADRAFRLAGRYAASHPDPKRHPNTGVPPLASAIIHRSMIVTLTRGYPDEELLAVLDRLAPAWHGPRRHQTVSAAGDLHRLLRSRPMPAADERVLRVMSAYGNVGASMTWHGRLALEGHRWLIAGGRGYHEATATAWLGLQRLLAQG